MLKIFVLLIFVNFCAAKWSEDLQVSIESGDILGRFMTSENGKPIRAFMGIPFAEPPVGDLRFKAPLKKAPWNGTLKTQEEPKSCLSVDSYTNKSTEVVGHEDCLYLNVYAPVSKNNAKLSVMVFIHGGAFFMGTGGYSEYPPEYFLDQDVILVTGNYRLGILGFLSFEDETCPGNFGLKDQSMMLQWVKTNIDKFGGDSNKITIFGESAGSASVNYHMISPMSKGLFDKAIMQSASFLSIWSQPSRSGVAQAKAKKLSGLMGCNDKTHQEAVECLRKVDVNKLTLSMSAFYEWHSNPLVPFPAVVEDFLEDQKDGFIVDRDLSKHILDIPCLYGMTSDEGLMFTVPMFNDEDYRQEVFKDWNKILPVMLSYDHLPTESQQSITEKITKFYLGEATYDESKKSAITELFSDVFFNHGIIKSIKRRFENNFESKTFVYQFSHKGYASYSAYFGDEENFYGTCHGDELIYLFSMYKTSNYIYSSIPTDEDHELLKSLVEYWVNFANTGKPSSTNPQNPVWIPTHQFPIEYMMIGNLNGNRSELFTMEKGLFEEGFKFWEGLIAEFPILN